MAACMALIVSLAGGICAAEAKEYRAAVEFFEDNGLSMDGLSRSDVKAVYRDITTNRFTYEKTAEVLERWVPGLEITQKEPTPEELAALWNRNCWSSNAPKPGISYRRDYQYKLDETLGFDVLDKSILSCYRNRDLLWTAEFPNLYVEGSVSTAAGTVVWGRNKTWSSEQPTYSSLALVNESGNIMWQRQIDHGFRCEYVEQVLDNGDGTWAEFNGRVYLSAYAVPKQKDERGMHEIANILDYVFNKGNREISSEELTPLVRDNYTAVLLLCDPEGGVPETFYSVKGSLGGKLSVSGAGELVWDVESVVSTFFFPATNSFTIGGNCQVFRYTFDTAGNLLRQEDTGETAPYHR